MKSVFEQYQEEFQGIDYCCYCLEPKGEKHSCCQENHFIPFEDLDYHEQKEIIEGEIAWAEYQSQKQEEANGR